MRNVQMAIVAGVLSGLSACQPSPGQGRLPEPSAGAPGYGVQQLVPRPLRTAPPWPNRWERLRSYQPAVEQELVDRANQGQQRGGRAQLFVSSSFRSAAREQSARMAARGAATLTDADRKAIKDVVSPGILPPRDYWIFINKVTAAAPGGAGFAFVWTGPRPLNSYNFYALKPSFTGIGVGVYRSGDSYYATVIVSDHVAPGP